MTTLRAPGRSTSRPLIAVSLGFLVAGCSGSDEDIEALERAVVSTYAEIVHASYEDALLLVRDLHDRIDAFVASPSDETLQAAKDAWLAAREPYGQTEAYRFYGGPIDDADGPEPMINAWPLDEGYVDYVEGAPESGIINDVEGYPTIDRETLVSANEAGAEENVSLGFHAIEFLLWGQDLSDDGPGSRPFEDYVEGAGPNADRRAAYLVVAADLLVDHLEDVVAAWDPDDPASYRARFEREPTDVALERMLVGIGVLSKSELAGERMFTAYDNQDQEDEHSCFSDNTHRDIIQNAVGIANVYRGEYTRIDGTEVEGTGLDDLLALVDPEAGAELATMIEESLVAVRRIPVPFDRAIVDQEARPLVLEAVYALQDQGDKIAEVGTGLGLRINTALPE